MAELCFSVTLRRGGAVSAILDQPSSFVAGRTPVVVLAHGAGADMRSDFMEWFATALAERGLAVVRFNFAYMERAGGVRRPPDRMETLLECYREVLLAAAQRTGSPPGPLFLGGKSMGGRVATVLVAQGKVKPSGMVLLGFPLHKSGDPSQPRSEHLRAVRSPILFVQGDRDPLCDVDLLRKERTRTGVSGVLHVVPGGEHSLRLPAANRSRQEAEFERAADIVLAFVRRVLSR